MRVILLLLIAFISTEVAYSQEIVTQVIAPTASGFNPSGPSIAYTVGELVIESSSDDSVSISNGFVFLADTIIITNIRSKNGALLGNILFPNPTINGLNVQVSDLRFKPIIELYGISGNLLQRITVVDHEDIWIDFGSYAVGMYVINVIHPEDGTVASYKILKN